MHVVREIKKYHHIEVANALHRLGYGWRNPKRRPTTVEPMLTGLPRCVLERLLKALVANWGRDPESTYRAMLAAAPSKEAGNG